MTHDWQCTCGNVTGTWTGEHNPSCRLNNNDLFFQGECEWDPDEQEFTEPDDLIELDRDSTSEMCLDNDCLVSRPHSVEDCQTTEGDMTVANLKTGTSQPTVVGKTAQLEVVTDARDIVEVALTVIHGTEPDKTIYDRCVEYFTDPLLQTFEKVSFGNLLDIEDCATFEAFGKQVINWREGFDSPPVYDCVCAEMTHVLCRFCGVMRANGDPDMPWIPTYERRVREVTMFFLGGYFTCSCAVSKQFVCITCDVQRWSKDAAWSYYDHSWKDAANRHVKTGHKPVSAHETAPVKPSIQTVSSVATYVKCRHYGEMVALPDGTMIMCSSEHKRKDDVPKPDFGCYMMASWEPDWLAYWLNWTDYGLPKMSMETVLLIVDDLLARSRSGQVVEIGCMGGHGRTGSLLALLIMRASSDTGPEAAMEYVWENYCTEAIEGSKQKWYIEAFHCWMNGLPLPEQPITPCGKWNHEKMFEKNEWCPKNCPTVGSDYAAWLEAEAKKHANSTSKPVTSTKSSTSKKTDPKSPATTPTVATSKYPALGDPVTWETKVPERDSTAYWCTQWRHKVMWMQHEGCDCEYWDADLNLFADRGFTRLDPQELAPGQPDLTMEEIEELIDDLIDDSPHTCKRPNEHTQPCSWWICKFNPALMEAGITISSAPAEEAPVTTSIVV